ncbi:hypothetical protein PFISCL1PPCAC_9629 [Pristionchus fissidentatus]|uniref:CXXC-type domain-containing protein n=1 Tax=Pristionchus fissidentatus TaxID=1538716 RepID=A0AAV5VHX1_9BILA|nr:hypothetical protein PFISCL1PPCAC_9629 [Pristionchus fissidentatus]
MNSLVSMGPMIVMDPGQPQQWNDLSSGHPLQPNFHPHAHPMAGPHPSVFNPHGILLPGAPAGQMPINASMNRSQRCGVCRGCQCKPCGTCTYCQDSPQFGGPGVKKQSCIERRCLRVLENRLQRDAPTFKARIGCASCEDCRMPDCQICLVCLDKRFFENRYMTGAMCAKKRCNNATSIELPAAAAAADFQQRQVRHPAQQQQQLQQLQQLQQPLPLLDPNTFTLYPADLDYFAKAYSWDDVGMTSSVLHNGDPFVPPSYAPECKNAVVLQPL